MSESLLCPECGSENIEENDPRPGEHTCRDCGGWIDDDEPNRPPAAGSATPTDDPRDGIIARLLAGWHPNDNEPFWSKWRTFQATGEFEPMTDAERAYLAGSATPTERDDYCCHELDCTVHPAVAGSAILTDCETVTATDDLGNRRLSECERLGYHVCGPTKTAVPPLAAEGSATPTQENHDD